MQVKKNTIKRITYPKPKAEPKAIAPQTYKPSVKVTEKGIVIGQTPTDLTFFQSLRLAVDNDSVTEAYRQSIWIYAAISTIAMNIAGVPFNIYRGKESSPELVEEGTREGKEGSLTYLFNHPNPQCSRYQLWEALMIYLGLDGECIWLLNRPEGKETDTTIIPTEIWPMRATQFKPIIENNVFVGWKYQQPHMREPLLLHPAQVIQFKYYNPYDPYRGLSPMKACEIGINQDWMASQYNLAFFKNSADPGGLLLYKGERNDGNLDEPTKTGILSKWNDIHQSPANAKRVALLEGNFEYKPIDISHQDMDFLKQKEWNRDEICSAYRISKDDIGIIADSNYANALIRDKAFWSKNGVPKMNYIVDVLWTRLFRHINKGAEWGMFDYSKIEALEEDFGKKVEIAKALYLLNYTPNMINKRLGLGMPDLPWGNDVFLPFSMTPASTLISGSPAMETETESPKELPAPKDTPTSQPVMAKKLIDREKYWNNFVEKILNPNERIFQSKIKAFIWKLRVAQLEMFAKLTEGKAVNKLQGDELDALIFSLTEWNKKLKELTRPLYETIMAMSGKQISDELGGLFVFNLTDPQMVEFLNTKLIKVTEITDTIQAQLKETLREGIALNETVSELQDRIKTTFNFASNRSLTIARTETAETSSGVRFIAMKEEGVEAQEWVSARDDHVRQPPESIYNHAIDGEKVKIGEKFSNGLLYPSDVNGEPGNCINCFTGGNVKIFTDKGFREIRTIKQGNMVLTHTGKFKPVTRIFKGKLNKDSDVIRISVALKSGKKKFSVTPEHRFLTNRGWIEARNLTCQDRLIIMAGHCANCGVKVPYYRKYCSHSCLSKIITKKQWSNPKHRENISKKTSQQLAREYESGIRDKYKIIQRARAKAFNKYGDGGYLKYDPSVHAKAKEAIIQKYGSVLNMLKQKVFSSLGKAGWHGSSLEREMERYLNKQGKKFVQQFNVGNRRVDFYIPAEKLFVECDNKIFHNDATKERKRDLEILLQYPNHRIAHAIYPDKFNKKSNGHALRWEYFDLLALNHTGTYEFTEISIKQIEKYQLKTTKPLYNFAVQDDESYLVYGIVSHNCRCLAVAAKLKGE